MSSSPHQSDESISRSFDWPVVAAAESFLRSHIESFLEKNSAARALAQRMRDETATDFFEWIDHLSLFADEESTLRHLGFIPERVEAPPGATVWHHPGATFPRVLVSAPRDRAPSLIALRPEDIADFAGSLGVAGEIGGDPLSPFRRLLVAEENGTRLEAVERRAYRGFLIKPLEDGERKSILAAQELWRTRPRFLENDADGMTATNRILEKVLSLVKRDLACHLFFKEERRYWQSRNRAAQTQKRRQDRLGLGWGNHDHHTFRCSRAHFVDVNAFLLQLGFEKRERYYAGAEAGWGAQISEQPATGIVVFADVDLKPDETTLDFSSVRLPAAARLGTVGLWVALHGESLLGAGMHHLECRFDFDLLRQQLQDCGLQMMNPFSNFDFLRQAFTEGERWPVAAFRAEKLLAAKLITPQQVEKFTREGALGSHLENLQRHGGFKGFNQKSVSAVITATDPRKNHFAAA